MRHQKRLNCSIALLLEAHLNEKEHKKLRKEWDGHDFGASCVNGKKKE